MGNLGWTEIIVILGIALMIFGPRKLPELGKSLGQSLAQFRKASEDFKRTWEDEVEMEKRKLDAPPPAGAQPEPTAEVVTSAYDSQDYISSNDAPEYRTGGDSQEYMSSGADEAASAAEEAPATAETGETVARETRRDWV